MKSQHIYWIRSALGMMRRPDSENLEKAMNHLAEIGVTHLVSLLPESEEELLGLATEKVICRGVGLHFERMPVPDFGTPADSEAFMGLAKRLATEIEGEGRVVVHCRGGIGRSSMLCACIMLQHGNTLEDSLERIAVARGHRVPETEDQVEWLRSQAKRLNRNAPHPPSVR